MGITLDVKSIQVRNFLLKEYHTIEDKLYQYGFAKDKII